MHQNNILPAMILFFLFFFFLVRHKPEARTQLETHNDSQRPCTGIHESESDRAVSDRHGTHPQHAGLCRMSGFGVRWRWRGPVQAGIVSPRTASADCATIGCPVARGKTATCLIRIFDSLSKSRPLI